MKKTTTLQARVEVELKARYDAEAARTGLDVSSLVRLALIRFLPTDESQVRISVSDLTEVPVSVVPEHLK